LLEISIKDGLDRPELFGHEFEGMITGVTEGLLLLVGADDCVSVRSLMENK